MTCPTCALELDRGACPGCGWKAPQGKADGSRTVQRGRTTFHLCAWTPACNMPVRAGSHQGLNQRTLCYFHAAHTEAADQTHSFETFTSWLAKLNKDYPNLGWWQRPAAVLWPVIQGQSDLS